MMSIKKVLIVVLVSVLTGTACHSTKTTESQNIAEQSQQVTSQANSKQQLEQHSNSVDSVHISDSTVVVIDNGIKFVSRFRDTFKSKQKTDTLRLSDTTTIRVFYNRTMTRTIKIATKQAQLSVWQKAMLKTWSLLVALCATLAIVVLYQNRKTINKYLRKS